MWAVLVLQTPVGSNIKFKINMAGFSKVSFYWLTSVIIISLYWFHHLLHFHNLYRSNTIITQMKYYLVTINKFKIYKNLLICNISMSIFSLFPTVQANAHYIANITSCTYIIFIQHFLCVQIYLLVFILANL